MKEVFFGFAVIIYGLIVPSGVLAAKGFSEEMLLAETQPDHQSHPRICSGSENAIYVVWSDKDDAGAVTIYFKRSLDGGVTFEETLEIEKNTGADIFFTAPEIGVDSKGTIFIIYSIYDTANGQFSLLLYKSENGGVSFDNRNLLTKPITGLTPERNYDFLGSDIKISGNGLYYTWSDSREMFLARSVDGWNDYEIIEIDADQDTDDDFSFEVYKVYPSLVVDLNNNIHVVWYQSDFGGMYRALMPSCDLYTARLENKQDRFAESKLIAESDYWDTYKPRPSIVVTSDGRLFIVFGKWNDIYAVTSQDMADTFSDPFEITFGESENMQNLLMAVDQNNVLHFLYSLRSSSGLNYAKSYELGNSIDKRAEIEMQSATADMHLEEKDEMVYVVWENSTSSRIYFSKAVDTFDSDSTGGGGGSGCLIRSLHPKGGGKWVE